MQPGQRRRCSDPRQPEDRGADVHSGPQGCGGLGAAGGHDNKAMSHKHLRKGLGSSKGETQPAPSEELRTQSPSARRSVATGQGSPSGPWDATRPGRGGHGWVWRPLMVLAADSTRLRDRRRALHPRTQPENSLCMPDFLGTPSPADPSDAASLRATVTAGDAGGAVRASPHTALAHSLHVRRRGSDLHRVSAVTGWESLPARHSTPGSQRRTQQLALRPNLDGAFPMGAARWALGAEQGPRGSKRLRAPRASGLVGKVPGRLGQLSVGLAQTLSRKHSCSSLPGHPRPPSGRAGPWRSGAISLAPSSNHSLCSGLSGRFAPGWGQAAPGAGVEGRRAQNELSAPHDPSRPPPRPRPAQLPLFAHPPGPCGCGLPAGPAFSEGADLLRNQTAGWFFPVGHR